MYFAAATAAVRAAFQTLPREKRSIKERRAVIQLPAGAGSDTSVLFMSDRRLTSQVCQIGKTDARGQVVNFAAVF